MKYNFKIRIVPEITEVNERIGTPGKAGHAARLPPLVKALVNFDFLGYLGGNEKS